MSESHDAEPARTVRRGDRVFHGLVAAVLAAVFIGSLWPVDVSSMPATFSVPAGDERSLCMLRHLSGMPCPTCGVSRSLRAIGQGEVAAAVRFHPLGPVYYGLLLVVLVRSAGVALRGRTWLERTARVLVGCIPLLAAVTVVVYAVRMWLFFASGAGAEAWGASPLGRLLSALL